MIYEKRGQYCFRWNGVLHKYASSLEARNALTALENSCQSVEKKTLDLSEPELVDTINHEELQDTNQNPTLWWQKLETE